MPTLSEVYIAERPDARDAIEDLEARLADASIPAQERKVLEDQIKLLDA